MKCAVSSDGKVVSVILSRRNLVDLTRALDQQHGTTFRKRDGAVTLLVSVQENTEHYTQDSHT